MNTRSYRELLRYSTYEDRVNYLKLNGVVSEETFGFDRYLNQKFYKSKEWINVRNKIILRDNSCDLGLADRPIFDRVLIHHINPIKLEDIDDISKLLDMDNLICVSHDTHNFIHYGTGQVQTFTERTPGDTKLW